MLATEQLQQSIIEGLHTETDPVHAAFAQEPRLTFGNAARIRFRRSIPGVATNPVASWRPVRRKSSCAVVRAVGVPPPKKIVQGRSITVDVFLREARGGGTPLPLYGRIPSSRAPQSEASTTGASASKASTLTARSSARIASQKRAACAGSARSL